LLIAINNQVRAQLIETYNNTKFSLGVTGGMTFSLLPIKVEGIKSAKLGFGGINIAITQKERFQLRFDNNFLSRGFDIEIPVMKVRYLYYDAQLIQFYQPFRYLKVGLGASVSVPFYNIAKVPSGAYTSLSMQEQVNAVAAVDLLVNNSYSLCFQYVYNPNSALYNFSQIGLTIWISKSKNEQFID